MPPMRRRDSASWRTLSGVTSSSFSYVAGSQVEFSNTPPPSPTLTDGSDAPELQASQVSPSHFRRSPRLHAQQGGDPTYVWVVRGSRTDRIKRFYVEKPSRTPPPADGPSDDISPVDATEMQSSVARVPKTRLPVFLQYLQARGTELGVSGRDLSEWATRMLGRATLVTEGARRKLVKIGDVEAAVRLFA